jgi:hypothetical protein
MRVILHLNILTLLKFNGKRLLDLMDQVVLIFPPLFNLMLDKT